MSDVEKKTLDGAKQHVFSMIEDAARQNWTGLEKMQRTQAALNAANAIATIWTLKGL